MSKLKFLYNWDEMLKINIDILKNRCNVFVLDIVKIV